MAGRPIGYVQAAVMVVGFCLFVGFMLGFFVAFSRSVIGEAGESVLHAYYHRWKWSLWSGLGLTAVAWSWAMISSIFILREVRTAAPPRIR